MPEQVVAALNASNTVHTAQRTAHSYHRIKTTRAPAPGLDVPPDSGAMEIRVSAIQPLAIVSNQ